VWNPLAVNEGKKWLKLICFNPKCGLPIIDESQYRRFPKGKRLDEASKLARTTSKRCVHCKTLHPVLKKDPTEPLAITAELIEDGKQLDKYTLYPHDAAAIFARISVETMEKLGKNPDSHPRNFVLGDIKVPPITIRPDVKKMGGGKSTNDDLTTTLQIIIKKSESLPTVIPQVIDLKMRKTIFELNNTYYDFVRASGEGAMNSLAMRWKGKYGRFRKNQMGKRVRDVMRSTIIGDPRIKIDEVGIPLIFAQTVQVREVVQEYNKRRLIGYLRNTTYPRISKVKKAGTNSENNVEGREIELEPGDTVVRDLIDGDIVYFNRQPSLAISNISSHRAKIIMDPAIRAILMNVIDCAFYNADFDGDAMNIIVSADPAARNEIDELASVANWLISHTTGSPVIGQTDDSIIGSAELTRSGVVMDKYHAMLLFQNSTILPAFTGDIISGRDCISKLLQDTPINFQRYAEWYNPSRATFINYDPTEIKVIIDQGKLVQGMLDKKSIGKGANGGIYHLVNNEYGPAKALELMFNMQQLAIAFEAQNGFTIGIMDLMISPAAREEINKITADIINKSRLITDELIAGEIVPPIGETIEEHYEKRQINVLSVFDDFIESVLGAINTDTNNLFKLTATGSKGKIDNMLNILSAIGPKLINGERIKQKFGHKRTLAYFPRFSTSPASRGFIKKSYLTGMSPINYIHNAEAARFDLISKALSTSVTGEQNRKSIKNLDSILINNFRFAVKHKSIVQVVYGEDYLDARKLERVKMPTVLMSDEALVAKYSHADFPTEFDMIRADRKKYREMFFKLERMNTKDPFSDERRLPMDVDRIIGDIARAHSDYLREPSPKELTEMVSYVATLTQGIPYVLINEIQEKRKMPVPEHIHTASWLLCMSVRSHLHPNALVARKLTLPILKMITDKIRLRYAQALIEPGTAAGIIAAQCFSEPLTQYMLDAHHRSASGGTSKSGMTVAREILGAREVAKLKSPLMLIPVLPEYSGDRAAVQKIANGIEMMRFRQFITSWQIFFEKYGEPVHPKYSHEAQDIKKFNAMNPLLTVPGDLIKWCIRFVIDRTALVLKNMDLEAIISRLRETFPDTYIMYTPENSANVILRVYIQNSAVKGHVTTKMIAVIKDAIADTIIRGINGILSAKAEKIIRNKVNNDGSIVRDDNIWGIITAGTNMDGAFSNPFVDKYGIITDAIQEVYHTLGVEAARHQIKIGLRSLIECDHRHYSIYADEMTRTGRVTSIESSGLKKREANNILLRMGFSSPMATIEEAAVNSMQDDVSGITAPLLLGSVPRLGTLYNHFVVNSEFVRANVARPDDILDALLD